MMDLSGCHWCPESIGVVDKWMQSSDNPTKLVDLKLAIVIANLGSEGSLRTFKAFTLLLRGDANLTSLDLSNNTMHMENVETLCHLLSLTLRMLKLSNCAFSGEYAC
jgi:hypothetical protein